MSDPRLRFLTGSPGHHEEILRLLDDSTVRITSQGPLRERRHQILLLALVDLLGRVVPRLDVDVEGTTIAAPGLPPGPGTIGGRLDAMRRRSPLPPQSAGESAVAVHIGPGTSAVDLYVDASEWQSYIGTQESQLPPPRRECAVGPITAACRAAAAAYALVLTSVRATGAMPAASYRSALTHRVATDPLSDPYPTPPGPLDLLQIGGGSIGGAAAVVFAYETELAGGLVVCDDQQLDETNPYRALLATAAAAARGAQKAEEVKAALAHHAGLHVEAHSATASEWEAALPGPTPLPLTLVAVDSLESRELIQDALPLDVINAAVDGDVLAISGHRTGSGPCVCCLHMPTVLDAAQIKNRLIANATGISQAQVNELRVRSAPLTDLLLRHIELHRRLPPNALSAYAGRTLDDLYLAEILYNETVVTTATGTRVAVAAPFVTALAGALLAAEAIKRCTPGLVAHGLGPEGPGIRYWENPYNSHHGWVDAHVQRADICLCRSTRRLRMLADLYGLDYQSLVA